MFTKVNTRVILTLSVCLLSIEMVRSQHWLTKLFDKIRGQYECTQWETYEREYYNQNEARIRAHQIVPRNIEDNRMRDIIDECRIRWPGEGAQFAVGYIKFRMITTPHNPIRAQIALCKKDFAFTGTTLGSDVVYGLMRDPNSETEIFHISVKYPLQLSISRGSTSGGNN